MMVRLAELSVVVVAEPIEPYAPGVAFAQALRAGPPRAGSG
jgi:hypothetical protein